MEDLKQRIKQMIVDHLFLAVTPSKIGDDEPLMENYGVDSVALFELVVGLEEDFGVSMEDRDFSVDTFRTVNTIAKFVEANS
ncbi:acyl carrier protein [Abditibacteriota bacterium]|nr:acyl carrier protein [Abditibacteriota bacterium]